MTTEDCARHEARLDQLESEVRILAKATATNAQAILDTRAELERRTMQIDQRFDALDAKLDAKFDAVWEELGKQKTLLESLEGKVRAVAEAHAGNTELLHAAKAEFEERFKQLDHLIIALDVKVSEKIRALDGKIDALDKKLDVLDVKLSGELARIATHLGIDGISHPSKRPPTRTTKRRKMH